METVKHNWGVKIRDVGSVYQGIWIDGRHYVGEGLSYLERRKERWQL